MTREMDGIDMLTMATEKHIDVKLKEMGFKHGLDYDNPETFTDDCEQAIAEIEEILVFQWPTLEKEIRRISWDIQWNIREMIDEGWT